MGGTTTLAKALQDAARRQPPKRTTPLAQALAEYEQPWSTPYGSPVMDNEMQQARARLEQAGTRSGLKQDDHLFNMALLQDVLSGAGQYVSAPFTGATQPFIQALGHALNYAGQVPSPIRAFGSKSERDAANAAGQTIGGDLTTLAQTLMGGVDTVSDTAGYPREYGREAAGLAASIAVPAAARGAVPYLARAADRLGIEPTAPNEFNMFIGPKAKTFPHEKVAIAERLESEWKSPEEIHLETGLHRGVDGKWRAEIDDSTSAITDKIKYSSDHSGVRAKFALMHPELYAAYPELAETKIIDQVPAGASGASYVGRVGLKYGLPRSDALSTLLHELQHEIQTTEGWARGGSPSEFSIIDPDVARDAAALRDYMSGGDSLDEAIASYYADYGTRPDQVAIRAANMYKWEDLHNAQYPNQAYRRLAGETESRNTQYRKGMTTSERATSFPLSTQDYEKGLQIVRDQGGQASLSSPTIRGSGPVVSNDKKRWTTPQFDEYERAFHGTNREFEEFNPALDEHSYNSAARRGTVAASSDPEVAATYAKGDREWDRILNDGARLRMKWLDAQIANDAPLEKALRAEIDANAREFKQYSSGFNSTQSAGANIRPVYARFKNPMEIDANGRLWKSISGGEQHGGEWVRYDRKTDKFIPAEPHPHRDINWYVDEAKRLGHDGLIIRNVIDTASETMQKPATTYISLDGKNMPSVFGSSPTIRGSGPGLRGGGTPRGLADLLADTTDAELNALKARLDAEAGQVGGAASNVSREQALNNLTEAELKNYIKTHHYKQRLEDGTLENIPGTYRVNPPKQRFNSEFSLADLKRLGDMEPTRHGEFRTQSYKEVYPDGTVQWVPGTLRVKKLPKGK